MSATSRRWRAVAQQTASRRGTPPSQNRGDYLHGLCSLGSANHAATTSRYSSRSDSPKLMDETLSSPNAAARIWTAASAFFGSVVLKAEGFIAIKHHQMDDEVVVLSVPHPGIFSQARGPTAPIVAPNSLIPSGSRLVQPSTADLRPTRTGSCARRDQSSGAKTVPLSITGSIGSTRSG